MQASDFSSNAFPSYSVPSPHTFQFTAKFQFQYLPGFLGTCQFTFLLSLLLNIISTTLQSTLNVSSNLSCHSLNFHHHFNSSQLPKSTLNFSSNLSGYSLNFHSCLHIGQSCLTCCELSHLMIQWMWKQCEHWPHTRGQSSPGSLQSGQQPSNGIRQIPQLSSFATHRHVATAVHPLIFTFILVRADHDKRCQRLGNVRFCIWFTIRIDWEYDCTVLIRASELRWQEFS
jgi:hypothetical protein